MTDLLKRLSNVVYTTGEDYKVNVAFGSESKTDTKSVSITDLEGLKAMGLSHEDALNVMFYVSGHEGAHVKYSDINALKETIKRAAESNHDLDVLNGLIQTAEDYRVDFTLGQDKPGFWVSRSNSNPATMKMFKDQPSDDGKFNFTKAVCMLTHGNDLSRSRAWKKAVDWGKAKLTAAKLTDIARKSTNSGELIDLVYELYLKEFHIDKGKAKDKEEEKDSGEVKDFGDPDEMEGFGEPGKPDKSDEADKSDKSGEPGDSESDESRESTSLDLEKLMKSFEKNDLMEKLLGDKTSKRLEKIKEKEKNSAEALTKEGAIKELKQEIDILYETAKYSHAKFIPLWSREKLEKVTEELCKGVHAGNNIMYCIDKNRRVPKDELEEFLEGFSGEAKQLAKLIAGAIKRSQDADIDYVSRGSKIQANRLWKPIHTNNGNVFKKEQFQETQDYVMDILLDASGSQSGRQREIQEQAFILAETFSILKMPCRVSQFFTRGTMTFVKVLRHFDEDKKFNACCKKYNADGDNRDGLALRLNAVGLYERPERYKTMIVLSDGAPLHSGGGINICALGGIYPYDAFRRIDGKFDQPVIIDCMTAVKEIRNKGVAVLGVYLGKYNDTRQVEKAIYGNDFANIADMSNFVNIIARYLIKHIDMTHQ